MNTCLQPEATLSIDSHFFFFYKARDQGIFSKIRPTSVKTTLFANGLQKHILAPFSDYQATVQSIALLSKD